MREEHSPTTRRLRELSPDELRQVAGGWDHGDHCDHDHDCDHHKHGRSHGWHDCND